MLSFLVDIICFTSYSKEQNKMTMHMCRKEKINRLSTFFYNIETNMLRGLCRNPKNIQTVKSLLENFKFILALCKLVTLRNDYLSSFLSRNRVSTYIKQIGWPAGRAAKKERECSLCIVNSIRKYCWSSVRCNYYTLHYNRRL